MGRADPQASGRPSGAPRSERVRQRIALGDEAQRDGIHAIALAGGRRAVVEDVSEMAFAAGATDFRPHHAVALVAHERHVIPVDGIEEAGPARSGFEFGPGSEEGQPAEPAAIASLALGLVEDPAERALGAMVEKNAPLFLVEAGDQRGVLLGRGRRQVEAGLRSGGCGHGEGGHRRRSRTRGRGFPKGSGREGAFSRANRDPRRFILWAGFAKRLPCPRFFRLHVPFAHAFCELPARPSLESDVREQSRVLSEKCPIAPRFKRKP